MTYEELFRTSIRGLSSNTMTNYITYIRKLDKEVKIGTTDSNNLIETMNRMIENYNEGEEENSGSRGGLMCRSAFVKLLELLDVLHPNLKLDTANFKERRVLKKFLAFHVIKQMIDQCKDNELKLIMMLQYETCSRIGDILALKIENIDLEERLTRMVTQKTGAAKTNAITETTAAFFKDYVKNRKTGTIFYSTYNDIKNRIRTFSDNLAPLLGNEMYDFSSHWLRASRAVHLYLAGVDLETIQREGGWATVDSLLRYLKMSGLEAKQTLEKVKPIW